MAPMHERQRWKVPRAWVILGLAGAGWILFIGLTVIVYKVFAGG
jgi:hypothetical protein